MLSMQPVRTLKQHACCQLLYMKMVGGLPPRKKKLCSKTMAWISPVSCAYHLCCYSHYSCYWATHKPDFTCVATLSPHMFMFPQANSKHKPLCCRSPRWGSPCNASLETCPAQTVVSCPAERKITITFILVQVDPHRFKVIFSVFT